MVNVHWPAWMQHQRFHRAEEAAQVVEPRVVHRAYREGQAENRARSRRVNEFALCELMYTMPSTVLQIGSAHMALRMSSAALRMEKRSSTRASLEMIVTSGERRSG
jgi:hypothetical protein